MKLIDKDALAAEIRKRIAQRGGMYTDYFNGQIKAYSNMLSLLNTFEVKEVDSIWNDARKTIPEDSSNQIICIKEDDLAVATVGKLVHGTKKWAYLNDLLNISDVQVKEVELENLFQALPEKIADEKSHQVYELSIYHYDGQCIVDYVGEIDHDSLYTFGGDTLYEAIEKAWNWLYKNSTGG